jgi:hypothetical protein
MIAAFMAVNTYLIDAFTLYAASAMAANTILRSVRCFALILLVQAGLLTIMFSCAQILGGVFPLFGLQMYNALGLVSVNRLADVYTLKRRLTIEQYVLFQSLRLWTYHRFETTCDGK